MSTKILVTGASGMVGRALVQKLIKEGTEVVACDLPGEFENPESLINSPLLELVENDIAHCNWDTVLDNTFQIIHLAAKVHVHKKQDQEWDEYYRVNVEATKSLCEAAVNQRVNKFIFLSTVGIYGDSPHTDELGNLIIKPNNDYARSKLLAEQIVRETLVDKVPYVILRPVMIFGPGDRGNTGRMIEAIKKKRFFVPGSGDNKRSVIYVDDIIEIICRLLQRDDIYNQEFIVSNRQPITLREMCDAITKRLANNWRVPSVPFPLAKVAAKIFDIIPVVPFNSQVLKKLTEESDFSPYTDIQDILDIHVDTTFEEGLSRMNV